MTKRVPKILIVVLSLFALFATDAISRSKLANLADKTRGYSFNDGRERMTREMLTPDMEREILSQQNFTRSSLGGIATSSAVPSPGITVDNTYEDWQWSSNRRRVEFRGRPDVQFVYGDQKLPVVAGTGADDVIGYNFYRPTSGGAWPQGVEVGCLIGAQDASVRAFYPNVDVNPDGFVIIGGHSTIQPGVVPSDNNIYYQGSTGSCFFGGGARIDSSQYNLGMVSPGTSTMNHPTVEVQIINTDTVQHILGHESAFAALLSPAGSGATGVQFSYYRKVGWGVAGAWTGPTIIGAGQYRGSMMSSRVSPKVAVTWVAPSPRGLTDPTSNASGENDIYYKESTDGGLNWPATATNITNYDRSVASFAPWIETNGLYDTQDGIHILWNGNPWPADVYNVPGFFFSDFSADLYHWSDANPSVLSRVMSADYGISANTQHCGFAGLNILYMGFFNISECDGNLYSVWSQMHAGYDSNDPAASDDCTDLDLTWTARTQRLYAANLEIYMSVSSTLDGLLWDASRNVTSTPTPNCDSATGNGFCQSETKASLSRYGMDEVAMAGTFGTLTWPGTEEVDLSPGNNYAGGNYLQLFYTEDRIPGNGTLRGSGPDNLSLNPLKWVRLACVDPITASAIDTDLGAIGYPDYTNHGVSRNITVTVRNDGNTGLNIMSIQSIEDAGPTGWLSTSLASLSVPAGASNTATFDIIVNTGGVVNSPGTIVLLPGRVRINSDAPVPNDVLDIEITYIVADTVIGVVFDTVNTGTIALGMTNHGNMGIGGIGGANMDYSLLTSANRDCDTTQTVYMFGGSPFIIQDITPGNSMDAEFKISNSFGQTGFLANFAFKPVVDFSSPSSTPTAAYDHFFSGTFVDSDTSIAVEREFFAPLGGSPNDNFVIVRTNFFSVDGSEQQGLLLGDQIDWDVPTEVGANNVSGIIGKTVYQQGVDTSSVLTACQPYANRFAGSSFLGLYTSSEFGLDACANDKNRWGVYAERNDSGVFVSPNGVMDSARVWTKAGALTGEWADTSTADLHIVQSFVYDYTLLANETLTVYTVMATVLNGTADDLKSSVDAACDWYNTNLRATGCNVCGCCVDVVGNIDNDGGVDIADLTFLIDHLFINFPELVCPEEGNVDGDGGIDIADLTFLIDHLFINFPDLPACP